MSHCDGESQKLVNIQLLFTICSSFQPISRLCNEMSYDEKKCFARTNRNSSKERVFVLRNYLITGKLFYNLRYCITFFKLLYKDFVLRKKLFWQFYCCFSAPVQASFRLQRPVSLLTAYTTVLERDIFGEIGFPNTTVWCQDFSAVPFFKLF